MKTLAFVDDFPFFLLCFLNQSINRENIVYTNPKGHFYLSYEKGYFP